MEDLPLCKCGCGERVKKKGNKFISGHNSRVNNPMHNPEAKKNHSKAMDRLFKDNTFLRKRQEATRTPEFKKKQSDLTLERWKDPEYRNMLIKLHKERCSDPEYRKKLSQDMKERYKDPIFFNKIRSSQLEAHKSPTAKLNKSKAMKKLWKDPNYREEHLEYLLKGGLIANSNPEKAEKTRQRMLNGQAIYMLSCIETPTKPQIELFKLCQKIFPSSILEYPCIFTNKSIDIAMVSIQVAVEYDGSYWHQDLEADRIRQEQLEEQGWSFVRYMDRIPSLEELQKDVLAAIKW